MQSGSLSTISPGRWLSPTPWSSPAAVAVSTQRVRIGFAVVEMALHHPVRLAVQTALLDNLSHGRLTVGTGRGSALNQYEYFGFGTSMEEGTADAVRGGRSAGQGVDFARRGA